MSVLVRVLEIWGVTRDSFMNMEEHIGNICKASYIQLRNIRSIRNIISKDNLITVVHAFITSRLDYCNSLLYGLPDCQLDKLQRIQNIAARIVSGAKKYDHITPVLKTLHWLPIKYRIRFKINLLTFRALSGQAPPYLTELLQVKTSTRSLRSSSQHLLCKPKTRLKTYGDPSFMACAPELWNTFSISIKSTKTLNSFKSLLKTFLFNEAFT